MNPFKDYGEIKNDYLRYNLTLKKMPKTMIGKVLDLGVPNPFTNLLKQNYPQIELINTAPDIDFDADKLPFDDETFDFVFTFEVIEHLMNPLWNLQECKRVLKKGGKIILTTPKGIFPSSMWLDTHFHEIDAKRLRILGKRTELEVTQLDTFNKPASFWLKMGFFRPLLRLLFGGWYYLEFKKAE